ncbi:ComEC/Rec2 family competence protein [Corynebacterium sp. H113]|uniref:ComEC/Rec2 family competence protein n=1 Tax=Corynebacterium sp. H113 TaxID=3133419 RepID=UPI00309682D2
MTSLAVARPGLDLRLIPAAVATWSITVVALYSWQVAAGVVALFAVSIGALVVAFRRRCWNQQAWGTALVIGAMPSLLLVLIVTATSVCAVALKRRVVEKHALFKKIGGVTQAEVELTGAPRVTEFGAMAAAKVAGLPGTVAVFGDESLLAHDRGTVLATMVKVKEADPPAISGMRLTVRRIVDVTPPDGHVARIRQGLQAASEDLWKGPDRLIPAMTLGDERGFNASDHEMMVDSGLAHLSAVSGANVALVVGAAMMCVAWASPRVRVVIGVMSLLGFVAVVGLEPSVLRAMMTGGVGLLAVLWGRRGQAIPALAMGIVVLLVVAPDLAVSVGFALSVAATAGLVLAVEPLVQRLLKVSWIRGWPAPVVRGTAVALVAHIVTAPVLALFIGNVSHVAVVANLVAAPAVAPVTVFGTASALATALGLTWVATALTWVAAPFAWWVYFVGSVASKVPGAAGELGVLGAVALVCFVVALWRWTVLTTHVVVTGATVVLCVAPISVAWGLHIPRAPAGWLSAVCMVGSNVVVFEHPSGRGAALRGGEKLGETSSPQATVNRDCRISLGLGGEDVPAVVGTSTGVTVTTVVVDTVDEITGLREDDSVARQGDGGVTWIVVKQCNKRARAEIETPDAVSVVCPGRDGPQAVYTDGRVWRGSNR